MKEIKWKAAQRLFRKRSCEAATPEFSSWNICEAALRLFFFQNLTQVFYTDGRRWWRTISALEPLIIYFLVLWQCHFFPWAWENIGNPNFPLLNIPIWKESSEQISKYSDSGSFPKLHFFAFSREPLFTKLLEPFFRDFSVVWSNL